MRNLSTDDSRQHIPPAPLEAVDESVASAVQRGMWLVSRLDPRGYGYNVPTATRLVGRLDADALQRSLDALVARHEILRTRFSRTGDGTVVQVADPDCRVTIETVDVSAAAAPDGAASVEEARRAAERHAERAARVPFDLSRAPLLRAVLVRVRPTEHVLVLNLHHAICDGWSVQLLLDEWSRSYRAIVNGAAAPVAEPPPPQYREYAAAENRLLTEGGYTADIDYWRDRLRGLRPLDFLPAHLGHAPSPGGRPAKGGAAHRFTIDADLLRQVDEFARRTATTRFVVLLAAYYALLARLGETDDVAVGTTVATRSMVDSDDMIGPLFNTIVLRGDIGAERSFTDLVARTRDVVLDAFDHHEVPFEYVLECVRAETPSPVRNPLFNAFFEVHHEPEPPLRLPGLDCTRFEFDHAESKTDLMVSLAPDDAGGLAGLLTYSLEVCDAELAGTLADRYRAALRGALRAPDRALSELVMMADPERTKVLERLPDGGRADLPEVCAHELIEWQAERTPLAVAARELSADAASITFEELNARANRLARELRERGVGPESRVAVLLPRSIDLLVAFLAVWKAGGAYLPLDPDFPVARLRLLTADSAASVVISARSHAATAAELGPPVIRLDADRAAIERHDATDLPRIARPGNLCYIIYTSGSTGTPKGVLVEHRGLVNFLLWCVRRYAARGDGGAPLFSSVAFDMVVPNLFTPLLVGQTVHIVPETVPPQDLGAALAAAAPYSFIKMTPGHLQLLGRQLTPRQARTLAELLVVGADAFPESVLAAWRELDPDTPILNEYGPTEASVANCVHEIDPGRPGGAGTLPIGRPIPNTTMYVLDRQLAPVPTGVVGELFIGGDCVVRGYANRPATTATSFLPDPYGPPGARLYRTGDLGRWLPDGELEFLGRVDQQVKIRGYRIEPAEIEAALTELPEVEQALVTVARTPAGTDALVGYVVPAVTGTGAGEWLDLDLLRQDLGRHLPAYLVPGAFVQIAAIPLNRNGKVDRSALPEPGWDTERAPRTEEPASPVERAVAEMWSEVLGIPAHGIGRHDNFFELGGDSLLMLSIGDRIRERLGATVSFERFLESPTIADMGEAVAAVSADMAAPEDVASPSSLRSLGSPGSLGSLGSLGSPGGDTLDGPGAAPPMIFVHPLGGTVFCYRHLITELHGDGPMYGLTLPSLLDERMAPPSLEDMAARYAQEIERVVGGPANGSADGPVGGPVVITAWSAGAIFAFETARRLRAAGVDVALLALLDPSSPDEGERVRWRGYERELRQMRERLERTTEERREAEFQAIIRSDLFNAMGIDPDTCRDYSLFPQDVFGIWERQLGLLCAYEPAGYDGPIAILTSQQGDPAAQAATVASWRRTTTDVVRHLPVPGDHLSMMRPPQVSSVAAALRRLRPALADRVDLVNPVDAAVLNR